MYAFCSVVCILPIAVFNHIYLSQPVKTFIILTSSHFYMYLLMASTVFVNYRIHGESPLMTSLFKL